jgi:hypothetical protein
MASVPGGQYTLFANGTNMNVVATPDGIGLPPPVAGLFNLELLTSGSGSSAIPPGYQGVAMLSPDGKTINMVAGDYGVQVTARGPHTVIAGTGNDIRSTAATARRGSWAVRAPTRSLAVMDPIRSRAAAALTRSTVGTGVI